jgi:hypothetical protein
MQNKIIGPDRYKDTQLYVFIACLVSGALAVPSYAAEPSGLRWVHGSWVNVRTTASPSGAVVDRITTNTQVNLVSEQGEWCEIISKKPKIQGFMACHLLGKQPLSLSEVGTPPPPGGTDPRYSPTRAFWLAPSVVRLLEAGQFFWSTMLNETQRGKEDSSTYGDHQPTEAGITLPKFNWEQRPQPVRFPIPEFEAMKTLLQAGVVAAPERRPAIIRWSALKQVSPEQGREAFMFSGKWFEQGTLRLMQQGKLDPVKPSLFKRVEELAPPSVSVEELSAQFGIRERMRVLSGPKWVHFRHENPRVVGSWDIGSLEITLEKPVIEYVIGRQGLAAAAEWTATDKQDVEAESGCTQGFAWTQRAHRRLSDYPQVRDPLVWFYTAYPLPYKKAAIKTYAQRLVAEDSGHRSGQGSPYALLVMHEIDLDGDGIPDLSVWEGMGKSQMGGGPDADDMMVLRMIFANIAGEWHFLDAESYGECT